jgi:hypothetical protein
MIPVGSFSRLIGIHAFGAKSRNFSSKKQDSAKEERIGQAGDEEACCFYIWLTSPRFWIK